MTMTSYISVCEDICIPTWFGVIYNNAKQSLTAESRQLYRAKEETCRSGDNKLFKTTKNRLHKSIELSSIRTLKTSSLV